MTIKGQIRAISISAKKGTKKTNVPEAEVKIDLGIVSDAHAGNWHRQISLLAIESIDKMVAIGAKVSPGNFASDLLNRNTRLSLPQSISNLLFSKPALFRLLNPFKIEL